MRTINEIHKELISGNKKVQEIVDEFIFIIKNNEKKFNSNIKDEDDINAILGFYSESFLKEQIVKAQNIIDEKIKLGKENEINILTGIPIVLKDNILIEGENNTSASKMLSNYISTYDATVVKKLKDIGAILIARANMDEFAMGGSGENSAFGKTKNPIDKSRVPGGSSSGSAAVVSYGGVPIALGSDTGGSIRLPAGFCNLVGFKPSYGMVSRFGLMAMGSSLDQISPIANNVEDVEIMFDAISGFDKNDATSISEEFIKKNSENIFKLKKKIGIPKILNDEKIKNGIDKDILDNFEEQKNKFEKLGYEIVEIDITNLDKALAVYYIITPAEVSSNMGRYDGVRYGHFSPGKNTIENFINSRTEGFGDEVRRRILIGTYLLSEGYFDAYYNKALNVREIIKKEFEKAFENVDAILTPLSPIKPWKFGEKSDPLAMYIADMFTVIANIAEIPAISIPTKKISDVNENNLPIGIQLLGKYCEDKKLLKIAKEFESLI